MNVSKINNWFALRARWIIRYRWFVLAFMLLIFAICFSGLRLFRPTNSWDDFFLENDPILLKTEEFKEIFGNDNLVAVLTKCDNTFTKKHLELIRDLSNELRDSIPYADKITSLTDIEFMVGTKDGMRIDQIVPEDIPADKSGLDAIRKKSFLKPYIANRLVSQDGKLTWIILKLKPFPHDSIVKKEKSTEMPDVAVGKKLEYIITKDKYKEINPKATGLPYAITMKMEWIDKEMPRLLGIALLMSLFILIVVTRSFWGIVVPIITAIGSIGSVYGTLGYTNLNIDKGVMLIPMLLTFAVSIAYNIHIFSFFKRRILIHGMRKKAVEETVGEMGWPILFSALTTFAALLSFLVIPMQPMRFIGIATSACVMGSFFIAIILMPIFLSFGKDRKPHAVVKENGGRWLDRKLENLGNTTLKYSNIILILSVVITVFFIIGFTKVETAFDIDRSMGRKIPYVKNIMEVGESELGSVYNYNIMINLPQEGLAKSPEILLKLDSLEKKAASMKMTKRTTSILNILKDLNQTLHEGNPNYYKIPTNPDEVAQLLLLYENTGGSESEYWIDYEYQRLRLMVELSGYNSGKTEKDLNTINEYSAKLFPTATVTTVGNIPQFTIAMQYIARGQILSFLISLIVIGILMSLVFGSVRIGLIGLIPNVLPAIVVGGLMGWMDYPLDMMTATIIPMILGLAIDDTIHFINHGHVMFYREGNYKDAILKTLRTIGSPIILTSVVICANFSVYTTSIAHSTANMGILASAGILTALLADLFITPILLKKLHIFGKEKK